VYIDALGGNSTISGTQFLSNTADGGGGVYVDDEDKGRRITLTNTTFLSNTATTYHGGGISIDSYVDFSISNGRFERNVARAVSSLYGRGGAVYSDGSLTTTARIENSVFTQNTGTGDGGAVSVRGNNIGAIEVPLMIINSQFMSNTGGVDDNGGGVYAFSRPTVVSNSTFISNSAGEGGGGVYIAGRAHIVNTNFMRNSATQSYGDGGGAAVENGLIENSIFQENTGGSNSGHGGGLYGSINDGNLEVSGTVFLTNVASTGGGVGVEYADEGLTVILTNTEFVSNTAVAWYGGGVFLDSYVDFQISDSRFERNTAKMNGSQGGRGGALFSDGYLSTTARIENTVFEKNASADDGGAVYVANNDNGSLNVPLEIFDTQFLSNTAGSYLTYKEGGAVYNTSRPTLVTDSTFISNSADYGGGIYVRDLYAVNTDFIRNTVAYADGGGVNMRNGRIVGGIFQENGAESGGGLYYRTSDANAEISGTQFLSNSAQ
jgi:predicted outer membrane repeat protein